MDLIKKTLVNFLAILFTFVATALLIITMFHVKQLNTVEIFLTMYLVVCFYLMGIFCNIKEIN